jgi:hypothetical protein
MHSTAGRAPSHLGITSTVPPGRSVAVRGYSAASALAIRKEDRAENYRRDHNQRERTAGEEEAPTPQYTLFRNVPWISAKQRNGPTAFRKTLKRLEPSECSNAPRPDCQDDYATEDGWRSVLRHDSARRSGITDCRSLAAAAPTTIRLTVNVPRPRSSAAAGYSAGRAAGVSTTSVRS